MELLDSHATIFIVGTYSIIAAIATFIIIFPLGVWYWRSRYFNCVSCKEVVYKTDSIAYKKRRAMLCDKCDKELQGILEDYGRGKE